MHCYSALFLIHKSLYMLLGFPSHWEINGKKQKWYLLLMSRMIILANTFLIVSKQTIFMEMERYYWQVRKLFHGASNCPSGNTDEMTWKFLQYPNGRGTEHKENLDSSYHKVIVYFFILFFTLKYLSIGITIVLSSWNGFVD